jgi:hypothetical protein
MQASDHIDKFPRTFIIGNLMEDSQHDVGQLAVRSRPSAIMSSGGTERTSSTTPSTTWTAAQHRGVERHADVANNIIANVTPAQASHMNLASSTLGTNTRFATTCCSAASPELGQRADRAEPSSRRGSLTSIRSSSRSTTFIATTSPRSPPAK